MASYTLCIHDTSATLSCPARQKLKQTIAYYYSYQSAAECVVVLVGDGGVGEVDRRVRDARSLTH